MVGKVRFAMYGCLARYDMICFDNMIVYDMI